MLTALAERPTLPTFPAWLDALLEVPPDVPPDVFEVCPGASQKTSSAATELMSPICDTHEAFTKAGAPGV